MTCRTSPKLSRILAVRSARASALAGLTEFCSVFQTKYSVSAPSLMPFSFAVSLILSCRYFV
ncbi:MAG: hypothetical protein C4339_00075 [Nitrososphaerota archaeon]